MSEENNQVIDHWKWQDVPKSTRLTIKFRIIQLLLLILGIAAWKKVEPYWDFTSKHWEKVQYQYYYMNDPKISISEPDITMGLLIASSLVLIIWIEIKVFGRPSTVEK